jgi:hypothetical protein
MVRRRRRVQRRPGPGRITPWKTPATARKIKDSIQEKKKWLLKISFYSWPLTLMGGPFLIQQRRCELMPGYHVDFFERNAKIKPTTTPAKMLNGNLVGISSAVINNRPVSPAASPPLTKSVNKNTKPPNIRKVPILLGAFFIKGSVEIIAPSWWNGNRKMVRKMVWRPALVQHGPGPGR